jgi:predicted nucleotidyltransferase component of viral defense system
MELDRLGEIKKLAIIAMFSDDDLMDTLVLKGGNLLDVVYQVASRASIDLDFSMASEFTPSQWSGLGERIKRRMRETFQPHGYEVFDVHLTERPRNVTQDMAEFWGGYRIEFKVITSEEFTRLDGDIEAARHQANIIGPGRKRTFKIDVSKFEYCSSKIPKDFDDYRIYIYSPEMLLFEKLRAICQQMPEYAEIVNSPSQSPRARDFFDIHTTFENFTIDLDSPENRELLGNIFAAKRVPLELLGRIPAYRDFHRDDFTSVKDTVKPDVELKDFNFYFDYVVSAIESLVPSEG